MYPWARLPSCGPRSTTKELCGCRHGSQAPCGCFLICKLAASTSLACCGEKSSHYTRPCSQVLSKWCDAYSRTPCREELSPTSVPSQSPGTCANTEGMQVKGMDMASGFPASPMAKARPGRLAYSQTGSHRTLPLEGQERNLS